MNPKAFQVTEWAHPHEPIQVIVEGHRMNVPYRNYLQMEIERWWDKSMREAWTEENSEGLVAMFTSSDGMIEITPEV